MGKRGEDPVEGMGLIGYKDRLLRAGQSQLRLGWPETWRERLSPEVLARLVECGGEVEAKSERQPKSTMIRILSVKGKTAHPPVDRHWPSTSQRADKRANSFLTILISDQEEVATPQD